MLRINVYDAKTARGNRIQYKECSAFENQPSYCAIAAWQRLRKKAKGNKLLCDQDGTPWTSTQLSNKFRNFIKHCKQSKVIPEEKYSWHCWRITFLNMAHSEFDVPLHLCAAVASHNSVNSTKHYTERTAAERKRKAAQMLAYRVQKGMNRKKRNSSRLSKAERESFEDQVNSIILKHVRKRKLKTNPPE